MTAVCAGPIVTTSAQAAPISAHRPAVVTSTAAKGAAAYGFFTDAVIPTQPNYPDPAAVTLGLRFTARTAGTIRQVRFFKGVGNTGTHRGYVWSSDGRQLAVVTFRNETSSGWQTATFGTPVPVRPGVGYVVGYRAPHGHYAAKAAQFGDTKPLTVRDLSAGSGLYSYGPGVPDQAWRGTGYYVDLRFDPSSGTSPTPKPSPAPAPTPKPTPSPTPSPSPIPTPGPTSSPTPTPGPTGSPGAGRTHCAADPVICGYPDASTTGPVAGTVLTRKTGSVIVDRPGSVIDGLDVTGEIVVEAPNVVIRNTRVTGGRGAGSSDWVVLVRPGADNLMIEDSELTTPAGSAQDLACVLNIGDSAPTVVRSNLHGCTIGVSSGGGLVADNYIHDLSQIAGLSHNNGVASMGGGGLTVRHNTIFNQYDQTSAVALYQDFGTQRDDLITDNLLAGGGYCVYGGEGGNGPTANIRIVGNRFSDKYSADCGSYGPLAHFASTDAGNAFSGNYRDDTLAPVQ